MDKDLAMQISNILLIILAFIIVSTNLVLFLFMLASLVDRMLDAWRKVILNITSTVRPSKGR